MAEKEIWSGKERERERIKMLIQQPCHCRTMHELEHILLFSDVRARRPSHDTHQNVSYKRKIYESVLKQMPAAELSNRPAQEEQENKHTDTCTHAEPKKIKRTWVNEHNASILSH